MSIKIVCWWSTVLYADPQPRCIASWMNWLFKKKCDENKLLQSKLQAISEMRCELFLSQFLFYFFKNFLYWETQQLIKCKFYVHCFFFEIPRLPSLFDDGNNDTEWDVLGKMIWFSYAIKMCVFKFSGGVRCAWFSDSLLHLQFYNDFSTNDSFAKYHLKIKYDGNERRILNS